MIDLCELIQAQRKNRGIVTRKRTIDDISNNSTSIKDAKEKVQQIIERGKKKNNKRVNNNA